VGGGLIAPIVILAVLLALVAARRLRAERRRRRDVPFDESWAPTFEAVELDHPLLMDLTLLRCGYDRRLERVERRRAGRHEQLLGVYCFAAGFGENRTLHTYTVLASNREETDDEHLIVTGEAPLAAAAMRPGWHQVARDGRWWIANEEALLDGSDNVLRDWLAAQPAALTLERHPGVMAVYQPAPASRQAAADLSRAIEWLLNADDAKANQPEPSG
jgi:hypothetical protein